MSEDVVKDQQPLCDIPKLLKKKACQGINIQDELPL